MIWHHHTAARHKRHRENQETISDNDNDLFCFQAACLIRLPENTKTAHHEKKPNLFIADCVIHLDVYRLGRFGRLFLDTKPKGHLLGLLFVVFCRRDRTNGFFGVVFA